MLTQKELTNGVIIPIRKLINRVKELSGFFFGKLQFIQYKMKTIAIGTPNFLPCIIDENGNIQEW